MDAILSVSVDVLKSFLSKEKNVKTRDKYSNHRKFRYKEIEKATNNFKDKIGCGGSGSVYKGVLKDGTLVAVKHVLMEEFGDLQRFEDEISRLAIYDLLPNGSLGTWIFPEKYSGRTDRCLSWSLRYKIAISVAKALGYLHHHDCRQQILDLNIKPENILLDEFFRAVGTDFGLSILIINQYKTTTEVIGGTTSYGKVLLDLFFGQRLVCLDQDGNDIDITAVTTREAHQTFHTFMLDKLTRKKHVELIDKRLLADEGFDENEVTCLLYMALWCLKENPDERLADIQQVANMLQEVKFDGIEELYKDHHILDEGVDEFEDPNRRAGDMQQVVDMFPKVKLDEIEELCYIDHDIVDKRVDENGEPKNKLGDIQLVGDIPEARKLDGFVAIAKKVDDLEAVVELKERFIGKLSAIASAQHFNLVRLRGYCSHVSETGRIFFIVYDFFKNGSLDSWIFPNGQFLSWKERCKVALDVAKALVYLHRDCRKQILHLDLKPENILVGDDFQGVLSDFGMSKLMSKDESSFHTEMTRGTRGYMAPEWNSGYGKGKSVDIFSYGKVLMDMFLGQRNVCFDGKGKDIYIEGGNTPLEQQRSLHYVKKKLEEKKVLDLIDKRLTKDRSVDERSASCFVKVALQCLKEDPRKRPRDMWEVLIMLEPVLKDFPDDKKEEYDYYDDEEEEKED
ncbi:hypothetical protein GIB67_041464 [Kingdonia uniflora]|uniref:Protein kinase domain-containing protein n=1 Tax=Kingdonia uniflora TaxID=39325 RepID=A0A7J7LRR1_9MAGN|nr:hypothetical protein GIB67_041464 [Kingdonia uniflora]